MQNLRLISFFENQLGKTMRKSHGKVRLRELTRYAFFACLIQFGSAVHDGSLPKIYAQQGNNFSTIAPKITEVAARTAAEKERSSEVKSASGSLAAITKYYRDYAIPTITLVSPSKINEVNRVRRNFEDDIEQLAKASKSFRASYNKLLWSELEKVIKDANSHPTARSICFGMAMQLSTEPAGAAPALPSRILLPLIASAIRPDEKLDSFQLLAIDAVERFLLTKSTQADEILSERHKGEFCKRISELLTMEAPYHRVQKSHQYMLERSLRTLTTMAVVGQANATTAKEASTIDAANAVAKFVKVALSDSRSSEWLKEACCASIGSIQFPAGTFTPEEALQIQQEVAKFSIKSMKDWLNKVAKSGSGAGGGAYGGGYGGLAGGGSSSYESMAGSGSGGYPGGGSGGYPGAFGNQQKPESAVSRQPAEVKNARRMLNQRLERIHLAFYGTSLGDGKELKDSPATRGIASFAPASEKYKLDHTIEQLREVQTAINSDRIADLASLSSFTNGPIREFGLACFEISGDRARALEAEADLYMSFFGDGPVKNAEGAAAEGTTVAPNPQGGPAAPGQTPAPAGAGQPAPPPAAPGAPRPAQPPQNPIPSN